jgi:hypothetical protein
LASFASGWSNFVSASADYGIALGNNAFCNHSQSYIWNGGNFIGPPGVGFSTSRSQQYVVNAPGGTALYGNVGIGTDSIANALTVNGTISAKTVLADIVGNIAPKFWIRTSGSGGQVAALSMDTLTWYPVQDGFSFGDFCRDASPIFYNGEWVTVYTCAFNSDRAEFGLARSANLSTWTPYRVSVLGPEITPYTPNNTWAPEWFVDNGNYYVFLRQSCTPGQNYGAPGQGFMRCLNPGAWTQWTNFALTSGLSVAANDPYIIKRNNTYHLFICSDNTGGADARDIVMRTSNSPFSGWSSTAVNLTSAMRAALYPGNQSAFFEGPSVVQMEGDWYRAFVNDGLINFQYAIDSFDGMTTWNQAIDKPLKYITPNYSIGQSLSSSGASHGTVITGTPEQYIALFASTKNQNGTVYQSVCAVPQIYQGNTATVYASAYPHNGKATLCVKFRNGSPIVLATEP